MVLAEVKELRGDVTELLGWFGELKLCLGCVDGSEGACIPGLEQSFCGGEEGKSWK
jgi:hypothetical protein